jgi:hypothetical protein
MASSGAGFVDEFKAAVARHAPRQFFGGFEAVKLVNRVSRLVAMLKENERGRFLRITEDGGKMRNSIMIPAPGLADFKKLLDEMVSDAAKTPPPSAA